MMKRVWRASEEEVRLSETKMEVDRMNRGLQGHGLTLEQGKERTSNSSVWRMIVGK